MTGSYQLLLHARVCVLKGAQSVFFSSSSLNSCINFHNRVEQTRLFPFLDRYFASFQKICHAPKRESPSFSFLSFFAIDSNKKQTNQAQ